jgi:hypothetical protein
MKLLCWLLWTESENRTMTRHDVKSGAEWPAASQAAKSRLASAT